MNIKQRDWVRVMEGDKYVVIDCERLGIFVTKKLEGGYDEGPLANPKSGFFDIEPGSAICTNPDHNAPSHISIPAGKGYRHVCPGCGQVSLIYGSTVTL